MTEPTSEGKGAISRQPDRQNEAIRFVLGVLRTLANDERFPFTYPESSGSYDVLTKASTEANRWIRAMARTGGHIGSMRSTPSNEPWGPSETSAPEVSSTRSR